MANVKDFCREKDRQKDRIKLYALELLIWGHKKTTNCL